MNQSSDKIETGVDKLISLVKEKEEVPLSYAANHLKVSRLIINNWCDVLEDQGVIVTRPSIKDRYIMSLDFYKNKFGNARSFLQYVQSFRLSTKVPEEGILKRKELELINKEREITKKFAILNEKVAHLIKYEELKIKTDEREKHLDKLEKELEALKAKTEKEKSLIDNEKNNIASEKVSFLEKKSEWSKRLKKFEVQKHELANKERKFLRIKMQFKKNTEKFEEGIAKLMDKQGSLKNKITALDQFKGIVSKPGSTQISNEGLFVAIKNQFNSVKFNVLLMAFFFFVVWYIVF